MSYHLNLRWPPVPHGIMGYYPYPFVLKGYFIFFRKAKIAFLFSSNHFSFRKGRKSHSQEPAIPSFFSWSLRINFLSSKRISSSESYNFEEVVEKNRFPNLMMLFIFFSFTSFFWEQPRLYNCRLSYPQEFSVICFT